MYSPFAYGWWFCEDFLTNDSISDAAVGKMLWEIDAISGGADTLSYETEDGLTFLRMTPGGSGAGDGSGLSLKDDSITFGPSGGVYRAVFRVPDISGNAIAGHDFKLGFGDVHDGSEPAVGAWFDVNSGVVECNVASANGDVNQAVTGHGDLTSGTTLVLGDWYEAEIKWAGSNSNADSGPATWEFYLNGILVAEFKGPDAVLDGAETCEPIITHIQDSTTSLELDILGVEGYSYRQQ